jgi:hypothetical protein
VYYCGENPCMQKIVPAIICLFFLGPPAIAQENVFFRQLRNFTETQKPNRYDSSRMGLVNRRGNDMHYLYPLYQAIGWESRFKEKLGRKKYYQDLSVFLAFAGDHEMAAKYAILPYEALAPVSKKVLLQHIMDLKNIQSLDAKTFIAGKTMNAQVVMIDESPAKPVHRAFTYSLLEDMYNGGFRYLAMETFNNKTDRSLQGVNVFTGEYTSEPVAGELVRKALELGYVLVSYEDTLAAIHTPSERDSIQAINLYNVIKNDKNAKILVQADYNHIAEKKIGDNYITMAMRFKRVSGIDPLTIEQTDLTEGSNFEYGRVFYQYFTQKFTITEPSVILENRQPVNLLEQSGYDVIVMHPPSVYKNNRPTWLSLYGARKETIIRPYEKEAFFVQAYYESEWREDIPGQLVPADQTYNRVAAAGFSLYLRPGRYKIVVRDNGYKVLAVRDEVIN